MRSFTSEANRRPPALAALLPSKSQSGRPLSRAEVRSAIARRALLRTICHTLRRVPGRIGRACVGPENGASFAVGTVPYQEATSMRSLLNALMLFFVLISPAIAADTTQLHVISARILVDGEEVMAPNIRLAAGHPAYISISDENKEPLYSLEVEVFPGFQIQTIEGTALQAVVWKGPFQHGVQLTEATLIVSPASAGSGPMSSKQMGPDGKSVELQVISYATEDVATSSLNLDRKSCVDQQGRIESAPQTAQNGGCCGGLCAPPSTNWYQCCNVTGCCVCGRCCIVP